MKTEEAESQLDKAFNAAVINPVTISRGIRRFVLMNEEEYLSLKDELFSLQRNLKAVLEVREGNSITTTTQEEFEELFDKISSQVKQRTNKD